MSAGFKEVGTYRHSTDSVSSWMAATRFASKILNLHGSSRIHESATAESLQQKNFCDEPRQEFRPTQFQLGHSECFQGGYPWLWAKWLRSGVGNDVGTCTICFYAGLTKSMNLTLRVWRKNQPRKWGMLNLPNTRAYNTSLQKKFDEIRLSGNLCFPVRYISLIKKRALKIFSMVPIFF